MNTLNTIVFIILLFALRNPQSDAKLYIEHSDTYNRQKVAGEQLQVLQGNVHIRQDTLNMYCDYATFYEDREMLEFIGNVLIDNGHRTLKADKIDYYPDRHWADCYGNVSIRGKSDSLFADRFSYDFKNESATARGHLYLNDQTNSVELWGAYGTFKSYNNEAYVETDARLVKIDSVTQDSFIVLAERFYYFKDSTTRAVAVDSVIILQGKLKAVCDSAVYFPDEEIAHLLIRPLVWFEDNELEGQRISAQFDSLKIRSIFLSGDAVARSKVDSVSDRINLIKGKSIRFDIRNKKPERITAIDNATSIYYLKEDHVDQGSNYATSDTIYIYFQDGELDSIEIIGGSEGIFYPDNYKGEKAFE